MFQTIRAALEVVYSTSDVYTGVQYVAIAASVFVVGTLIWFLFIQLLEYVFLSNQRRRQAIRMLDPFNSDDNAKKNLKKGWVWRPWAMGGNALLFFLKILFVVGVGFIIWLAGGASGFNPWTTGATMMVIGVLITYTLALPLGQWGAGFGVTGSNMISVGEYWEFQGMPNYDGWITGIYSLEVEMMRFDEKSGNTEIISMPLSVFLQTPRKRKPDKEAFLPLPYSLVGQHHWKEQAAARKKKDEPTRTKLDHRLHLSPELLL